MSLFHIILFSKIILSLNYIKIPFERTYKEKITKNNYLDYLINSKLTCKIPIGTPEQIIPFHIKLNKYATFISSSNIKEINNDIIKFNEIQSSSYEKSNKINYYSPNQEFSYGIESIDNFNLKNDKNKKLNKKIQFILATSLRKNESAGLGLDIHIPPGQNLNKVNLINQLKDNKDINSYGFSFYFENKNYYLILGAYPNEYNSNYDIEDFLKIQTQSDNNYLYKWGIKSDKIIYNNKTLINNKIIFFEPSIKAIIGTSSFYLNVTNDFFNEYLNKNKCKSKVIYGNIIDDDGDFLFFYCDNDVDISNFKSIFFVLNGFNYELSYKDLFESFENEIYFLVGFKYESDQISNKQNWIMGQPFFSKNILVFDQNYKIIGFYTKTKKFKFIFIFPTLLIILLIAIIILLIFYFYRYIRSHRKIRANELDDNFDYLPQN